MQPQMTSVASSPTVDTGKDLFVLSDEQILDIAPVTETSTDDGQHAADAGSSEQQVSTNSQTERTAVRSLTTEQFQEAHAFSLRSQWRTSGSSAQTQARPRQDEKAVEIAKKTLDIASYKLYYVNYEIGHNRPSTA